MPNFNPDPPEQSAIYYKGRNWKIIPSTSEERETIRQKQRSKFSAVKRCWLCDQEFGYGYSSMHLCGACKILVKCAVCGKEFELDMFGFSGTSMSKVYDALFNGEDVVAFCSNNCHKKHGAQEKISFHQKNPDVMKYAYRHSLNDRFCEKCGKITQHRNDYCVVFMTRWQFVR